MVAHAKRTLPLNIRIATLLTRPSWVGHCALDRRSDLLGVFPERTGTRTGFARLPRFPPLSQFGVAQLHIECAGLGIKFDEITISYQADRAADRSLRADMTDAEPACGAGETAVGDERNLGTHPLPVQGRGSRQHFAH